MYNKNVPQDVVVKQYIAPRNDAVYKDDRIYCPMCEHIHWNDTNCQRVD